MNFFLANVFIIIYICTAKISNKTVNRQTDKQMATAPKTKQRLNYACGMNASSVKKMCTFIFGEYFHSLKINLEDRRFDLYMHKEIEDVSFVDKFGQDYIDYFNEYWSEIPGFKIRYYLGLNIEDL